MGPTSEPDGRPPRRRVGATELRQIFNSRDLWATLEKAPYTRELHAEGPPAHKDLPRGTVSRVWSYWIHGKRVALVHEYVFPDGTRSRPDPKYLHIDGEVLYL